jgi:hypothetical protein
MITKKQNSAITVFLVIIMLCIQVASSAKTPSDLSKASIIPKPVSITATGGYFTLKPNADIYIQGGSEELKKIGQSLADKLKQSTGFSIEVITTEKTPKPGNSDNKATIPGKN